MTQVTSPEDDHIPQGPEQTNNEESDTAPMETENNSKPETEETNLSDENILPEEPEGATSATATQHWDNTKVVSEPAVDPSTPCIRQKDCYLPSGEETQRVLINKVINQTTVEKKKKRKVKNPMEIYETNNPWKSFTDKFENQMKEDEEFFGLKNDKRKEISPINSENTAYDRQMEDFMHNSALSITSLEELQNEKRFSSVKT